MMKNGNKNNHIDVAVIPAAGFGTRMLPAAKAVPKELLPVLDKPVIQYVIEEAVAAGCSDALLVTSREKRAIEDHFDRAPELEDRLQNSGKTQLLAGLIELREQIRVHSVRQSQQLGLGHAVLQARQHVGDRSFFCMLGDTIFTSSYRNKSWLFRIAKDGDPFSVTEVWNNNAQGYMSTPVVVNGHAYLHMQNQRVTCINLATGERTWTSNSFGKYWSMIAQGDRILALDARGSLVLMKADSTAFTEQGEVTVSASESWAHVAVGGNDVVVRELDGLSLHRWTGATKP